MKTNKKRLSLLLVLVMVATMIFSGCTLIQVSGDLALNTDGSGTRTIKAHIAKDDYCDGSGSAYYYFKQSGDELAAAVADVYAANVPGSEEWLTVAVDDSSEEWEVLSATFAFDSFEDYTVKLAALAYDENFANLFVAPTFDVNEAGEVTYVESTEVMTAIFKSLQATIMADETMFDINCTKDGEALNDGSADLQSLTDNGIELMKPDYGVAMTITVDGGEATAVEALNGVYTFTNAEGNDETVCVLHYTFDDTLANSGAETDSDLVYGVGSTDGGPVYEEGLEGKAIRFDGKTYLTTPNRDYKYSDMTVSFNYRMDALTETDNGSNMVLVPAGLGALGVGVIDLEFIKDTNLKKGVFLAKMNGTDWQSQDKLIPENYYVDELLGEWHNYTVVFQNEYDDAGEINDSFMFIYIDGKLATKQRLAVAAGLTYSLGLYDKTEENPVGGFNVGGYYEAETVKRGLTGALDNLMVFNGALSEEEVNTLCYTTKVDKEYDPSAEVETPSATESVTEPATEAPAETPATDGANTTMIIVIVVIAVVAIAAGVIVSKKKKADK